jgi:hypothetical protein
LVGGQTLLVIWLPFNKKGVGKDREDLSNMTLSKFSAKNKQMKLANVIAGSQTFCSYFRLVFSKQ